MHLKQRNIFIRKLKNKKKPENNLYDVVIVGGGITGISAALALAKSDLRILLIDKGDIASGTSQTSSNLIWGGIKYLQQLSFFLVFKLCQSRNKLLKLFPFQIRPIRFLMHVEKQKKPPGWLIFLGACLYYFIGSGKLGFPKILGKEKMSHFPWLQENISKDSGKACFTSLVDYGDGILTQHDARFCLNLLFSAKKNRQNYINGLKNKNEKNIVFDILSYVSLTNYQHSNSKHQLTLKDELNCSQSSSKRSGDLDFKKTIQTILIQSKLIINATGLQTAKIDKLMKIDHFIEIIYSKGIHLIIPQIFSLDKVLAFFDEQERLFFAIPMMGQRICIGTTDSRLYSEEYTIFSNEIDFLLEQINQKLRLKKIITRDDIISYRVGIRPLASKIKKKKNSKKNSWIHYSRKHFIKANDEKKVLSIYGGKLTDCLNIATEVRKKIKKWHPKSFYSKDFLPKAENFLLQTYIKEKSFAKEQIAFLRSDLLIELWSQHGSSAIDIAEKMMKHPVKKKLIFEGAPISYAQVEWMRDNEMVYRLEDFLRRRTLLAQLYSFEELKKFKELKKVCQILFGNNGEKEWKRYFNHPPLVCDKVEK